MEFYKYRRWGESVDNEDRQRAEGFLLRNEVYFPSPADFNDPFDCTIPITFDLENPANRDRFCRHLSERYGMTLPAGGMESVLRLCSDRRWVDDLNSSHQRVLEAKTGIYSLADNRESLLMWSHYAEAHRGFCVGLDQQRLTRFMTSLREVDGRMVAAARVEYDDRLPDIVWPSANDAILMQRKTLTKASVWQYEGEFRFFMLRADDDNLKATDRLVHLPQNIITSVSLGCAGGEDQRATVRRWLKQRGDGIRLYQARKKSGSFGLDFIPLDY